MRALSLIAVVVFVSSLAAPAQAGMQEDCEQESDIHLIIRGCTAAIRSGKWQGTGLAAAYSNRCYANIELGRHDRAIEDCNQALRTDPGFAKAYINRGYAYLQLGKYRRAIQDSAQALRLDPDYVEAYSNRAWTLHLSGQSAEALAEFERAMRVGGAAQVQAYQKALAKHGHYQGTIDGVYTPQTKAALAACLKAGCRLLK